MFIFSGELPTIELSFLLKIFLLAAIPVVAVLLVLYAACKEIDCKPNCLSDEDNEE